MKIHPKDYKFVNKNPDKGFDPKHNQKIIDEVIEESEKLWEAKKRAFSDNLEERTDAVASYFKSLSEGGANSNVSKYFGRKYMLYLKGQDMLQRMQEKLTIVKNGKVMKKAGE